MRLCLPFLFADCYFCANNTRCIVKRLFTTKTTFGGGFILKTEIKGNAFSGLAGSIGKVVADASAKTAGIATKAQQAIVNTVDKNGNGKIDAEDFAKVEENLQQATEKIKSFASVAGQNVKSGSELLGKALSDAKLERDRKYLRPVFSDEMLSNAADVNGIDEIRNSHLPSVICIVARDKKRSESEICNGAVGYRMAIKGVDMLNLYEDSVDQFGLSFYPNIERTIYHVAPYQDNLYICLDEYFDYLKKARVNELELIAQDLGATRVQITFKEHKKDFVEKSEQLKEGISKLKSSFSYDNFSNELSSIEVAADVKFSGHDTPVEPDLLYFKNESDIEKLVQMRTGGNKNKIESKTYKFQCNRTSGIKEKEALQLDAVLNQLKCGVSAFISKETKRENRTELEYTIEF